MATCALALCLAAPAQAQGLSAAWPMRDLAITSYENIDLSMNGRFIDRLPRQWLAQVVQITDQLARELDMAPPELVLVADTSPNAFATYRQGGTAVVGVNTAMMRLVDGDASTMAAVIGHELGHLKAGHQRKAAQDRMVLGVLGAILGAALDIKAARRGVDTGGAGQKVAGLGAGLILSKFSRDQEREADEIGVRTMARIGLDPFAAGRLWDRMQSVGARGSGTWLDGHPSSAERSGTLTMLALALRSPEPTSTAAAPALSTDTAAAVGATGSQATQTAALTTRPVVKTPLHAVPYLDSPGWACIPGYRRVDEQCEAQAAPVAQVAQVVPVAQVAPVAAVATDPQQAAAIAPVTSDPAPVVTMAPVGAPSGYPAARSQPLLRPGPMACAPGSIVDGKCIAQNLPANAHIASNGEWECDRGFITYEQRLCIAQVAR